MFEQEGFYEDEQFSGLKLESQTIKSVDFQGCEFKNCSFVEAIFEKCCFESCVFHNCNFSLAKVRQSGFTDSKFVNSKLVGIDWTEMNTAAPIKFNFEACNISNSSFFGMTCPDAIMTSCEAVASVFSEALFMNSNFSGTNFEQATFVHSDLSKADFSEAKNYSINPAIVKIEKATFSLPEAMSLLSGLGIVLK
ncbi:MAG: fluoroquinolone resistance protein [Candidatus Marinamargulisbacteria bacterium]